MLATSNNYVKLKSAVKQELCGGVSVLGELLSMKSCGEKLVWCVLFIYFLSFNLLFLTQSDYVGNEAMMMGYDTRFYLADENPMIHITKIFKWNIRHPLLSLLYLPLLLVDYALNCLGCDIGWPMFLTFTTFLMSFSGLLLFKIFRVNGFPVGLSIMLLAFFCSFAHVMLLSVQVDSFVLTIFFSLLLLLVTLKGVRNICVDNLIFFGMTGATSTNCLKVLAVDLLSGKGLKDGISHFIRSILLFSVFFCLTGAGLVYRIVVKHMSLGQAFMDNAMEYVGGTVDKLSFFWNNFLSEPLLFHYKTGVFYSTETETLGTYLDGICQFVIGAVCLLVVVSLILNRKELLSKLFVSFFCIDIVIHFVVGYGLTESQLFCGHWFFFVPVLVGMLCMKAGKVKACAVALRAFLLAITVFFFVHNLCCFYNSL